MFSHQSEGTVILQRDVRSYLSFGHRVWKAGCPKTTSITLIDHCQPRSPLRRKLRLVQFNGVVRNDSNKPLTGMVGIAFAFYEEQEGGVVDVSECKPVLRIN